MLPIALTVLQALPSLLSTGFNIYGLVTHANAKPTAAPNPTEQFAANLLAVLPNLIDAGVDVISLVNNGAARVALMVKENRGPTEAEKADQAARLAALDADYDKAAGGG